MADTEILLESGTNEIEIMQFTINDELYGINKTDPAFPQRCGGDL